MNFWSTKTIGFCKLSKFLFLTPQIGDLQALIFTVKNRRFFNTDKNKKIMMPIKTCFGIIYFDTGSFKAASI